VTGYSLSHDKVVMKLFTLWLMIMLQFDWLQSVS
jgi:hypothetical protein